MVNMLALCVAVCVALLITVPTTKAATLSASVHGLYTTNGTNILKISESEVKSVHDEASGRIVGLAYSYQSGYVFWSDISLGSRGIYRATTDSAGKLNNVEKIVSDDVLEVNGLTVDWISSHIYWTDGRKRSVEVAEFDGTNRRILITERLSQPRGVYADPVNGYLFWNDQGYHQIERSRLDGSNRDVFVSNTTRIHWPNQMTVLNQKLYWVDSKHKTLESVNMDKSGRSSVSLTAVVGTGHVYGLTIFNNKAYVSCWKSSASIVEVPLPNGTPRSYKSGLSTGAVFSNIYIAPQPSGTDPCTGKSCELCLPTSKSTSRCSCPSYGGKVLKGSQCVDPTRVVLYTLAESGYVGFYDPDAVLNDDLYFVARSLRPVAVAYDPVDKNVYWSDVRERTIHRVKLDGRSPLVLLDSSRGIGVVDGLAVDHANRRLYYTNVGSVTVDYKEYSWHKIETVRLDSLPVKVRTIVSSHADRPRAIAIDSTNGHLYYTDWGKTASVVRTQLDGSNPTVIKKDGLNNPNGIAIANNTIYVTDSHYKTRVPANARTSQDGSLYSMNLNGGGWTDELSTVTTKLKTPFGLTANGRLLYVSDWDQNAIFSFDFTAKTLTKVISDVSLPMALEYTTVSEARASDPCSSLSCDICIKQSCTFCVKQSSSTTCTCDSYKNRRFSSNTCDVPSSYLLVSDMDGVKMVSVDGSDDKSVYVAAVGRPFSSNLVALAYDAGSNTAYYSDVRRKAIYALSLSNSSSTEFYRVNHIIDGMTLHNGKLYWTDSLVGRIASLDINAARRQHQVLKPGLSKPRAIVVTNSYVYWTEWGSRPGVARMRVGSSSTERVGPPNLKWPNALFVKGNTLYIADSHPTKRQLFSCSLPGVNNCQTVAQVNSATVAHMYDIWVSNNDILVYTDWKNKSVNMLSLTTGTLLNPLAKGLMRPSQLIFVGTQSTGTQSCSTSHGCSDDCIRLFGSQQCVCSSGERFNGSSSKTCVAPSTLSCTDGGTTYQVGSTDIKRSRCERCQCFPNTLYASAGQLTCHSIQCPVLDCSGSSTPSGECCPRCVCDNIDITNCPSSSVKVSLPASRDEVLYRFMPSTRDCDNQGRHITTKKMPQGDIYRWNGEAGHDITVTASVAGTTTTDTCKFKIIPTDTTRPTVTCPGDVRVYTDADKTTVDWQSPQVSDNVGVEADKVTSSPARGSEFSVGTRLVTYTATDRAGLQSSCTFNVVVVKRSGDACKIPKLQRGHLVCQSTSSSFACSVQCDNRYSLKPGSAPSQITCDGGNWNPAISADFERLTCVRVIAGTAQGSISVTADNVCNRATGTLQYDYTKEVLEYKIDVNYLTYSLYELKGEVTVAKCGSSRRRRRDVNDVVISVTISGDYETRADREYIRQDITYILQRIQEDLLKGFLVVPFRDDAGIWSAGFINDPTNVTVTTDKCPKGSYSIGSDKGCILCPAGTRVGGQSCELCPEGEYNDRDGQDQCTPCPDSKTSPAGSYNVDQCTPGGDDGLSLEVIIGIVVAAVLLIIIVIVIIVVVICVRKRRKNSSSDGPRGNSHNNEAFDDPFYSSIPENNYEAMKDKEPAHTYSSIADE